MYGDEVRPVVGAPQAGMDLPLGRFLWAPPRPGAQALPSAGSAFLSVSPLC